MSCTESWETTMLKRMDVERNTPPVNHRRWTYFDAVKLRMKWAFIIFAVTRPLYLGFYLLDPTDEFKPVYIPQPLHEVIVDWR